MGEQHHEPFQLSFNSSLRVDFRGSRVTSDGGLIVVRELDEWLGMGALIEQHPTFRLIGAESGSQESASSSRA